MFCYICKKNCQQLWELKDHFQNDHCFDSHNGKLTGFFVCKEENCDSCFNRFDSFSRHVTLKHLNLSEQQSMETDEVDLDSDINFENRAVADQEISNEVPTATNQNENSGRLSSNEAKILINKVILEIRCKTTIPESTVRFFIDSMLKIVMILSTLVQSHFHVLLETMNLDMNTAEVRKFLNCLDFAPFFKNTDTFAKQIKHNLSDLDYTAPEEKYLGQRIDTVIKNNVNTTKVVKETFQYIPFIQTLKTIFKFTNLKEIIRKESQTLIPDVYTNYRDGSEFKNHPFLQKHDDVLRINLYYDDIDVVNPIGSQSAVYKVACFYFTIQNACFFNSKLDNIFILAICYNSDIKKYGFEPIMKPFLEDLKKLESDQGVLFEIDCQNITLRATLTAFVGDSLAAHDILGFSSPSSTHFCRQCMITKGEFHQNPLFNAQPRTENNHNAQLQHIEASNYRPSVIKLYGVKQDSVLNSLKYFHCTNNFAFDPMHDLLEGVVPYTIKLVLKHFIQTRQLFTVFDLNQRINNFRYGVSETTNKPSPNFTQELLNSSSNKLKQKSAQCWLLLRVLPFLIGNFLQEIDHKYLRLLAKLTKICSIVFSPALASDAACELDETVNYFLLQFQQLFGDKEDDEGNVVKGRVMIPKGHWLRHYSQNLLVKGPSSIYSCMRFEGKHYSIKQQIAAAHNFINVPKSIIKRQSLLQSFNIKYNCFTENTPLLSKFKFVEVSSLSCTQTIAEILGPIEFIKKASCCIINNVEFKSNFVIRVYNEIDMAYPNHALIKDILESEGKIYFNCKVLETCDFDNEFYAFEVRDTSETVLIEHSMITDFFPASIWYKYNSDTQFVGIKYAY
jgi:hypothetical protein